jgi:hypothetical protein
VIPAIPHDDTISRPGSLLYRLAGAVARGFGGNLRPDLLSHKPRASARDTPPDERKALLADAFGCANLPAGCSKVVIVDDNVDTCATGEAMASALKAAAARAGQQLTVCLVCVARCVKVMKRAANAHLPVAVRERLDAALDKDTAAVAPLLTREQRGIVYRTLNYVGSSARAKFDAGWTDEDMVAVRAKEHNRKLKKGIHDAKPANVNKILGILTEVPSVAAAMDAARRPTKGSMRTRSSLGCRHHHRRNRQTHSDHHRRRRR